MYLDRCDFPGSLPAIDVSKLVTLRSRRGPRKCLQIKLPLCLFSVLMAQPVFRRPRLYPRKRISGDEIRVLTTRSVSEKVATISLFSVTSTQVHFLCSQEQTAV